MSVAISDMQAVPFTRAVWKARLSVQMERKKMMKLACSEKRERWMAESQSDPSGRRVHFAQCFQNIKQAASYNFWMNNPLCCILTPPPCFSLKSEE